MITGFFLQIFYALITFLIGLLPTLALPSGFTDALTLAMSYVNQFTFLFPVSSLLAVVSLALTFHAAILAFDFTLWIIHTLRGR